MIPAAAPAALTPARMAAIHAASFTTPRPWSEDEIRDLLCSPFCFLLTEADGFLIGRSVAGEAELLTLAVDPLARRSGQGRRLVARFLAEAAVLRATSAFLEVADDNAAARALYVRAGFAEAGRRRGYYHMPGGASLDAVIMVRALQPPETEPSAEPAEF